MYEHLGLAMVVASWIACAFLLKRWKGSKSMSISQHAASDPNASKLFAAVLIVVGGIFYVWLSTWFAGELGLGTIFQYLLHIAFLTQIVIALVPDKGKTSKQHKIAAYFGAGLSVPLSICVLYSNEISNFARYLTILGLVYMAVAFLIFIFARKLDKYYLVFQLMFILVSQLIIVAAVYT